MPLFLSLDRLSQKWGKSTGREEVSEIKKAEEGVTKRMNLNVPLELHNSFKSVIAAQGENMTDVLLEFIRNYVTKHAPKKGRRP